MYHLRDLAFPLLNEGEINPHGPLVIVTRYLSSLKNSTPWIDQSDVMRKSLDRFTAGEMKKDLIKLIFHDMKSSLVNFDQSIDPFVAVRYCIDIVGKNSLGTSLIHRDLFSVCESEIGRALNRWEFTLQDLDSLMDDRAIEEILDFIKPFLISPQQHFLFQDSLDLV